MSLLARARGIIGDPWLALLVTGLSVFGVAMIYSAGVLDTPRRAIAILWQRQLIFLGIAMFLALLVMWKVELRWLEWAAWPFYIFTIGMLVAALFIGTGYGTGQATRRWLDLGPILIQPAQFANLAAVILLARLIGSWRAPPQSVFDLWLPIAVVVVPMALVVVQPDLGTALVFVVVLLAALFWGGTPYGVLFMLVSPAIGLLLAFVPWVFSVYMLGLIAFMILYRPPLRDAVFTFATNLIAGTVAIPVWESLAPYQRNRLLVFLDPGMDPQGAGYQLIQSQVAIGAGGLTGQGFTYGTQKRLDFLPEQHTDFIYSVVGEEFGFVGTTLVLLALGLIFWRITRVAERTPDPFAGILAFGIFAVWFTHSVVNIGMTIGVMPITGIPLPFLSYGGSFLLVTFLAFAIVQRAAAENKSYR
jgi:rod shape determining protein RodA